MRTDQELTTFSEHVLYEMTMLVGTPEQIEGEQNDVKRNALLESFAIHARQLVKFFFDHADPGETVASDYFVDPIPEWKRLRGKEDAALKDAVKRASEEIAHLTWARTQPKRAWNLIQLVKEIEPRCLLFVKGVSPTRISATDKARFLDMLQKHNSWVASLSPRLIVGPAGPAEPVYTTCATSTAVSSGYSLTGKTQPINPFNP